MKVVVALAAILARYIAAAEEEGCYPAYQSSPTYNEGDWVSAITAVDEPCVYGQDGLGCSQNNIRVVTKTFNYICRIPVWCKNIGYAPDGQFSILAWEKAEKTCSGTAEIPVPPAWSGGGGKCPQEFSSAATYGSGDVVSHVCSPDNDWCTVFKCKNDLPAPGKFCDMHGYEPGSSQHWSMAWDDEGSCEGEMEIEPTSSPTYDHLDNLGKCPGQYVAGSTYVTGDRVSKDGLVFQCKKWPFDGWCGRPGYEPLDDFSVPDAWKYAWDILGHCSGTIETTADAGYLPENSLGVCPPEYSLGTQYGPGEFVSVCSHEHWCLVYRCASDMPHPSRWCGLDGYQPGSGEAWTMAWTEEGYCTITAAPTMKPTISSKPSSQPSESPSTSALPSSMPSTSPSSQPSMNPSASAQPSEKPSVSTSPSSQPSEKPSVSTSPSSQPSEKPSVSTSPSSLPSEKPSVSTSPSSSSQPTVVTLLDFEGITTSNTASVPRNYGGLDWINFNVFRGAYLNTGFEVGTTSGEFVAYNGGARPASMSSTSPFTVLEFYATSRDVNNLAFFIESFGASGNLIDTYQVTLSNQAPTLIDLRGRNFANIYRLQIRAAPNNLVAIDDMLVLS